MVNINNSHRELENAQVEIENFISRSPKGRLQTVRVTVSTPGDIIGKGDYIVSFDAPAGVIQQVTKTGSCAVREVNRLFDELGLKPNTDTAKAS